MNIEDLTFGQMKQIAALMNVNTPSESKPHPFVGKFVICRCYSAGVHAGELVSQKDDQVVLKNSRRLWQWMSNGGVALSGLSQLGLKSGKVDALLPEIALTGVIETIPCSDKAKESIHEYK